MSTVVIIPARYSSSRLPGKPLAPIAGRPLILHVIERVAGAKVDDIIVATDHQEIRAVVAAAGGCRVVMTRPDHPCGTDRIAEVAAAVNAEHILNVQGDQLIAGPEVINGILAGVGQTTPPVSTLYTDATAEDLPNPNVVKVVVNRLGHIVYMSRLPIPYHRGPYPGEVRYRRQVGIYLFERRTLLEFADLAPTALEAVEGVELLRALDYGIPLGGISTDSPMADVDIPSDLALAERFVREYPVVR
ncbi:MAG: 3-deoxy-manno-octulosonate cytidylyltransferase [Thermodesulfobacteriota bacterium]